MKELDLIETIQTLLINMEAGCPLEKSLENSLGVAFKIEGATFVESLNRKAKVWNDKTVFRFVRLINQYHKGGAHSTLEALEKMLGELYTEKMSNIKKKAEKTSIILTLLLMLSLISIIIVVITPVVITLKSNL